MPTFGGTKVGCIRPNGRLFGKPRLPCFATIPLMLHHIQKKTKNQSDSLMEVVLYFFVFTTPLFEIPQAILIYTNKSADGVSLLTWGYFAVSSVVWLIYGLREKLKPIIFAYSSYLVIELIIVAGILKYS